MSDTRKTTKRDFRIFEETCRHWWKRLGVIETGLRVCHRKVHARAEIDINWEARCAVVSLGLEVPKEWADRDIRESALHEMLHLLMARVCYPAMKRTSSQDDMEQYEESVVRTLEAVIGELAYGRPSSTTES